MINILNILNIINNIYEIFKNKEKNKNKTKIKHKFIVKILYFKVSLEWLFFVMIFFLYYNNF